MKFIRQYLLILLAVMHSAAFAQEDVRVALDGMARAFRELNYDLSFVYQRDGYSEPMRLVHAFHNGRERERLVHLNGQPREVVREGDVVTAYFPNRAPVILDKPAMPTTWTRALVDSLNQLPKHYRIEDRGETRVAGRLARLIQVQALDGKRYGYRLWIDSATNLLLRSDIIDPSNRILEQWQVVSLRVLELIPENDLHVSFVPPHATTTNAVTTPKIVAELPVAAAWQVNWLPDGFQLKQRQWQMAARQPVEHLLFSDGMAAISVYVGQPLSKGVAMSRQLRKGGMVIYEVADASRHVTVVGDIPPDAAKRIAISVANLTQQDGH